jgi:hypothetical protein
MPRFVKAIDLWGYLIDFLDDLDLIAAVGTNKFYRDLICGADIYGSRITRYIGPQMDCFIGLRDLARNYYGALVEACRTHLCTRRGKQHCTDPDMVFEHIFGPFITARAFKKLVVKVGWPQPLLKTTTNEFVIRVVKRVKRVDRVKPVKVITPTSTTLIARYRPARSCDCMPIRLHGLFDELFEVGLLQRTPPVGILFCPHAQPKGRISFYEKRLLN